MNRQSTIARSLKSRLGFIVNNGDAIRLLVLIGVVVVFAILTNGLTLSISNVSNVIIQSAIRGIAACGQALVIITGGIDLSVSGVVALTIMVGGSLMTSNPDLSLFGGQFSPVLVLPLILMIGMAVGLVNGVLVANFRLPALLVTLATWQICLGLAYQVTGSGFVNQIPGSILALGQGSLLGIPMPILILLVVVLFSHFLLVHTTFGSSLMAVGGNPRCAHISGIKVTRTRAIVFGVAGLLYGVAAVVNMSYFGSATMAQTTGLELATIAAVAIGGVSLAGGRGSIVGVLLGALIIGVIDNGLGVMGVGPSYQNITKGLIIIAVVTVDGYSSSRFSFRQ